MHNLLLVVLNYLMYYLLFLNYIKFYGANTFNVFLLNMMSSRKIRHIARGFLNAANR
jgi:hypothetical protein